MNHVKPPESLTISASEFDRAIRMAAMSELAENVKVFSTSNNPTVRNVVTAMLQRLWAMINGAAPEIYSQDDIQRIILRAIKRLSKADAKEPQRARLQKGAKRTSPEVQS